MKSSPAGVDAIEQLEKTLSLDLRQRIAQRFADDRAASDQLQIGRVGEREDMIGTVQLRHEARRFAEHLREALAFGDERALGRDALGRLDDDRHDAAGPAAFADHRRVVQIHPDALRNARAMRDQFLILVGKRVAGKADAHDVVVEIGDFRPAFAHLAAEQARMAASGKARIGIVVEHDAVLAPQQHDRHRRMDQEADDGLELSGQVSIGPSDADQSYAAIRCASSLRSARNGIVRPGWMGFTVSRSLAGWGARTGGARGAGTRITKSGVRPKTAGRCGGHCESKLPDHVGGRSDLRNVGEPEPAHRDCR